MDKFYVCNCFFTHNYFLKDYGRHVTYHEDDDRFSQEWRETLRGHGCESEQEFEACLQQVKTELQRRRNLGPDSLKRCKVISEGYKPLHPHLYKLQESFLSKDLRDLVTLALGNDVTVDQIKDKLTERANRVYALPVFTSKFCSEFIEELCHFEKSDMPKGRPNTMNNYGILLNEMGFDPNFITPLRENYLQPLSKLLFPDWGGACLDSHKAFIVTYKMDEDLDLNFHYDNAEVTLNVSLGKEFSQGSLYFCDMRQAPVRESECNEYEHKATIGLLHRGQHMHGALPISGGERYNLIIWMRASSVRNRLCPMCDKEPTLVQTVGYGDGYKKLDNEQTVNVCRML